VVHVDPASSVRYYTVYVNIDKSWNFQQLTLDFIKLDLSNQRIMTLEEILDNYLDDLKGNLNLNVLNKEIGKEEIEERGIMDYIIKDLCNEFATE